MSRRRTGLLTHARHALLIAVIPFAAALAAPASAAAQGSPTPSIEIGDVIVDEQTGTPAQANFAVTLSAPSASQVQVDYTTVATSGSQTSDFANQLGTLTFAPGTTTRTISVAIVGDGADENTETFEVQLSNPVNAVILDASGLGTIVDDDPPPTISIGDTQVTEGTGSNRQMVFTVSLSAASGKNVNVSYATVQGTATETVVGPTANGDFTPRQNNVGFASGVVSVPVSITIRADPDDELDESFSLRLVDDGSIFNATIGDGTGVGTIIDDDGPTVSVGDVTIPAEGNAGQTTAGQVPVTLSAASPQPVTFTYVSTNDTATAPDDYQPVPSGSSITIPAGQTVVQVPVTVRGDDIDEADEKFRITVSSPVNATLLDPTGVVTITDDDATPTLSVAGVQVNEGTGGTSSATLTVVLSAPSGRTMLGGYATKDGTAIAGSDYQQAAELLTFNPGDRTKTIAIPIAPDNEVEENESFEVFVFASGQGSEISAPATVTLIDDDLNEGTSPRLSITDVVISREGLVGTQEATFTVSMDRPLGRTAVVGYGSKDGTATAPADYVPVSGQVVFLPGERSKTIPVAVLGDGLLEFNHDFNVELSDPRNAIIGDGSGLGIITDDDAGGGPGTIAQRSVKATDLLCVKRRRCAGVLARWTVAAPGTMRIAVTGVVPKRGRTRAKTLTLVRTDVKVKAGRGSGRGKRAVGKTSSKLLKQVRAARMRRVTVTVTFSNLFGGQELAVTKVLTLSLK